MSRKLLVLVLGIVFIAATAFILTRPEPVDTEGDANTGNANRTIVTPSTPTPTNAGTDAHAPATDANDATTNATTGTNTTSTPPPDLPAANDNVNADTVTDTNTSAPPNTTEYSCSTNFSDYDLDGSGILDLTDTGLFTQGLTHEDLRVDFNHDGSVESMDERCFTTFYPSLKDTK